MRASKNITLGIYLFLVGLCFYHLGFSNLGFSNLAFAEDEIRNYEIKIDVDFSKQEKVANLSGFLGTLSEDLIADEHIVPLRPALMSVENLQQLQRAQQLGLEPYVLLSSYWGYPGIASQFRLKPPYKDIEAWKNAIRPVIKEFGSRVTYYVWNEPDMPIFFGLWLNSSDDNFYKVFHAAHDVIREELGSEAKISGPTFSFLNSNFEGFMNYARDNHLQIDVLSFHLLYQKDSELEKTMEQVKALRKKYIDAGNAYEKVGLKEIHVNEYLRADRQNSRPASILNFLREMEQAGVDKASRACWGDPSIPCFGATCMVTYFVAEWVSPGTCRDGSINGLINKHKEPRASWWAYNYYARGVDNRVQGASSSKAINVLASSKTDSGEHAQVILVFTEALKDSSNIKVELHNLKSLYFISEDSGQFKYRIKRIPYSGSGAKAVNALVLIDEGVQAINHPIIEINTADLKRYEVLVVELSPDNDFTL